MTEINTGSVGQLGIAWSFDIDEYRPVESTPVVVNGVMYVTSGWSVV